MVDLSICFEKNDLHPLGLKLEVANVVFSQMDFTPLDEINSTELTTF
jgi:hypothetical protein